MQRKNNSQVTVAYEYIRDRIINYTLSPGAPLSDNKLAKELDMSRAPIREAILLLQMDGLVREGEDGRVSVSPITIDDIADIVHVRCALESEAVRLIAEAGWPSKKDEAELVRYHEKLTDAEKNGTIAEHYHYDDLFHTKLAALSNSPRINETLGRMRLQMQRARWLNLAAPGRQSHSTSEHEQILNAFLAHDRDACMLAVRSHLENCLEAYRQILADRQMQTVASMISNFFTVS